MFAESSSLSKIEGDVAKHALASLVTVITEAAKTDADAQTLAYVVSMDVDQSLIRPSYVKIRTRRQPHRQQAQRGHRGPVHCMYTIPALSYAYSCIARPRRLICVPPWQSIDPMFCVFPDFCHPVEQALRCHTSLTLTGDWTTL